MVATRRRFLVVAALAALPADQAPAGDRMTVMALRLTELVSGTTAARRIAATYLAEVPETDFRRAAIGLDMPAVLAPAEGTMETFALRTWLGARIRADFEMGAVIDVAGWRLSRTEVGACLLVASVA